MWGMAPVQSVASLTKYSLPRRSCFKNRSNRFLKHIRSFQIPTWLHKCSHYTPPIEKPPGRLFLWWRCGDLNPSPNTDTQVDSTDARRFFLSENRVRTSVYKTVKTTLVLVAINFARMSQHSRPLVFIYHRKQVGKTDYLSPANLRRE